MPRPSLPSGDVRPRGPAVPGGDPALPSSKESGPADAGSAASPRTSAPRSGAAGPCPAHPSSSVAGPADAGALSAGARALGLFLLLLLALPGGAQTGAARGASRGEVALQELIVKPGDTLWSLAQRYLEDPTRWTEILKYNKLPTDDPTVALPGMRLKVPVVLIKETLRSARVVLLVNEVLLRKRETPQWAPAAMGQDLTPGDSLRTMQLAQTRVRFATGEELHLMENSLAVLAPPKVDAEAQLLKGQVVARRSRLVTATARITPKTRDTDYSAKVMDDLRTVVQVFKGLASVEAQGTVVDVPEGFASEVPLNAPPSLPRESPKLPDFAAATAPAVPGRPRLDFEDGRLRLDIPAEASSGGDGGPRVQVSGRYAGFRLQVAEDREFQRPALDRQAGLDDPVDLARELRDGRYWWRIALVDAFGFESPFTEPRVYERRSAAPPLAVLKPAANERVEGTDSGTMVRIEGTTEPGAAVEVGGETVSVDAAGRFARQMFVRPGPQKVEVVARNRWGDTVVAREFVYAAKAPIAAKAEKAPVLPEQTIEERVIKPFVIPTLTVAIFVVVALGLIVLIF